MLGSQPSTAVSDASCRWVQSLDAHLSRLGARRNPLPGSARRARVPLALRDGSSPPRSTMGSRPSRGTRRAAQPPPELLEEVEPLDEPLLEELEAPLELPDELLLEPPQNGTTGLEQPAEHTPDWLE
jgi:hypothetical protein